jgi:hypothetical protein
MYPRNAASPERISIGAVVQISDGAVQTAGVTVRILPFGGSEADGVGTVAYSTDGVVLYTPTQGETNYTSFVLIAKKTGCIPASVTVVTSASAVAGHAGTDQSKITNNTATVNLSGTTIKTATDVETDTQDIQSRLPTALVDGRMVSVAEVVGDKTGYTATVSDKTGFKLASDGLALVTAWTVGITGSLTGNVTGSVGSISGVTFPDNFGSLDITVGGAIAELGANALTANGAVDAIPSAVFSALTTATWPTDSFGKHILISNNNNRSVQVTGAGSGHIAADIHALQVGVITSAAFAANWFTAAGLAADAATEVATAVAATQALSRLDSMIESDGSGQFRFDTIALSMAPAGGGGGNQTINVYPVSASTPERVAGTTITYYRNEIRSVSVVTDFTLTNLTLSLTIEDAEGTDLLTIANASISRSGQTFTVSIGTDVTASVGNKRWALRDITGGTNSVIARGVFSVQEAA